MSDTNEAPQQASILSRDGPRYLGGSRVATDAVAIILAVEVVLLLDIGAGGPLPQDTSRAAFALLMPAIWMITLWQTQSRATSILTSGVEEYRRVLSATVLMVLTTAALAYFADSTRARSFVVAVTALGLALILGFRAVLRQLLLRQLRAGHPLSRVYVVAAADQTLAVRDQLTASAGRYVEVGHWQLDSTAPNPDTLVAASAEKAADALLVMPTEATSPEWLRRLAWALESTELSMLVSPALVSIAGPRLRFEQIEQLSLIAVDQPRFTGPQRTMKRAFDLISAGLGLIVLALPMAIIAAVIRIDSTGPALFRQPRRGIGDTTFTCLKFRTMRVGADQELERLRPQSGQTGATFKLVNDPRVTRVGTFLRRTSLDEIPQLWNVLRGEMSLVGPRPHQLSDVERYDADAARRLLCQPGMTGLWQVSGRSDTTWEDNVWLDLYYVENWSPSLDVAILLRTVVVVITQRGAH